MDSFQNLVSSSSFPHDSEHYVQSKTKDFPNVEDMLSRSHSLTERMDSFQISISSNSFPHDGEHYVQSKTKAVLNAEDITMIEDSGECVPPSAEPVKNLQEHSVHGQSDILGDSCLSDDRSYFMQCINPSEPSPQLAPLLPLIKEHQSSNEFGETVVWSGYFSKSGDIEIDLGLGRELGHSGNLLSEEMDVSGPVVLLSNEQVDYSGSQCFPLVKEVNELYGSCSSMLEKCTNSDQEVSQDIVSEDLENSITLEPPSSSSDMLDRGPETEVSNHTGIGIVSSSQEGSIDNLLEEDTRGLISTTYYGESKEMLYVCEVCNKSFRKKHKYQNHKKRHIKGKVEHVCKICDKFFASKHHCSEHQRRHVQKVEYVCKLCGKSFKFKQNYSNHQKMHKEVSANVSLQCGKGCKTPSDVSSHMRSCQNSVFQRYPSDTSEQKYFKFPDVPLHHEPLLAELKESESSDHIPEMSVSDSGISENLSECKDFRDATSEYDHKLEEDPLQFVDNSMLGKCAISEVKVSKHTSTDELVLLKDENYVKVEEKSTRSSITTKVFGKSRETMYVCEICDKPFAKKRRYARHKKRHCLKNEYWSERYKRKYGSLHNQEDYLKQKEEHMPKNALYMCEICGKSYKYLITYKLHKKLHKEDKTNVCLYCGKSWKFADYLKRHMRSCRKAVFERSQDDAYEQNNFKSSETPMHHEPFFEKLVRESESSDHIPENSDHIPKMSVSDSGIKDSFPECKDNIRDPTCEDDHKLEEGPLKLVDSECKDDISNSTCEDDHKLEEGPLKLVDSECKDNIKDATCEDDHKLEEGPLQLVDSECKDISNSTCEDDHKLEEGPLQLVDSECKDNIRDPFCEDDHKLEEDPLQLVDNSVAGKCTISEKVSKPTRIDDPVLFKDRSGFKVEEEITRSSISTKVLKKSKDITYVCEICDKAFTKKHNFTKHKKRHCVNKEFLSEGKNESLLNQDVFLKQEKGFLSGKAEYKCEICQKSFAKKFSCARHKKIHEVKKEFVSEGNNESPLSEDGYLKQKQEKGLGSGKKSYACEICNKSYKCQSSYNAHNILHRKDNPNVCLYCRKCWRSPYDLKRHLLKFHKVVLQKSRDGAFEQKRDAQASVMNDTTKERQCPSSVTVSNETKNHGLEKMKDSYENCDEYQTDKKHFACKICNKIFKNITMLRRHELIHPGKISHKCLICGCAFAFLSDLRRHKRRKCYRKKMTHYPRFCSQVVIDTISSDKENSPSIKFDFGIPKLRECYVLLDKARSNQVFLKKKISDKKDCPSEMFGCSIPTYRDRKDSPSEKSGCSIRTLRNRKVSPSQKSGCSIPTLRDGKDSPSEKSCCSIRTPRDGKDSPSEKSGCSIRILRNREDSPSQKSGCSIPTLRDGKDSPSEKSGCSIRTPSDGKDSPSEKSGCSIRTLRDMIDSPSQKFGCGIPLLRECYVILDQLKQENELSEKKRYVCEICDKSYKYQGNYNLHKIIHRKDNPNVCLYCRKCWKSPYDLRRHVLGCRKVVLQRSRDDASEQKHDAQASVMNDTTKERQCPSSVTVSNETKNHGLEKMKDSYENCDEYQTDKKHFACKICNKIFKNITKLRRHELIHPGKISHKCSICGCAFSFLLDFWNHRRKCYRKKMTHYPRFCSQVVMDTTIASEKNNSQSVKFDFGTPKLRDCYVLLDKARSNQAFFENNVSDRKDCPSEMFGCSIPTLRDRKDSPSEKSGCSIRTLRNRKVSPSQKSGCSLRTLRDRKESSSQKYGCNIRTLRNRKVCPSEKSGCSIRTLRKRKDSPCEKFGCSTPKDRKDNPSEKSGCGIPTLRDCNVLLDQLKAF